jgi:mannose-1-phosphate guanylyltransferase
VVSIGEPPPGGAGSPLAYTGVQVVDPKMLQYLPTAGQKYDLVKAWREALAAGERLAYLKVEGHFWQDIGTPENYLAAHRRLLKGEGAALARYFQPISDPFIGPGARIGGGVKFGDSVCVGANVVVGEGAFLKTTVIWDRAVISAGVELENCIVAAGVQVNDCARGQVLVGK